MKKIFVCGLNMEIGGAERALLSLLHSIDLEQYDVDLFLHQHRGSFMSMIPNGVHLLPEQKQYAALAIPITTALKYGQLDIVTRRLYAKAKAYLFSKKNPTKKPSAVLLEYIHKHTLPVMPRISNTTYDLAISFCAPHYFVSEKVNAKKKIAWIHTDYNEIAIDIASEFSMWNRYDHIISISDDVTNNFCKIFPSLENKIIKIENILVPKLIFSSSNMFDVSSEILNNGCMRLLSIGRFCNAKNFDNIPEICKYIIQNKINVTWYIIGFGNNEKLIRDKIKEFNVENNVIILGKKDNPYPYIAACDLYVQPSRYEGKAITVQEAQCLGKPVIITNYPTAKSQLKDGFDGIIVPLENDACAEKIINIINDTELLAKISENAKSTDYSNYSELEKLYKLIDD